jgi:hypothetical protein
MHSYKDFQFPKMSLFDDEFVLKSNLPHLVNDSMGLYDISRAIEDDE